MKRWSTRGQLGSALIAIMILSAYPLAAAGQVSQKIVITASNAPAVVVNLEGASSDCQLIRPNEPGARSDYCVYVVPVEILVLSNGGWTGTIAAQDIAQQPGPPSVKTSALRYSADLPEHYSDAASSPHLSPNPATWATGPGMGEQRYSFYFFLRLNNRDNPSAFSAIVTFSVTQHGTGLTYALDVPVLFNPIN